MQISNKILQNLYQTDNQALFVFLAARNYQLNINTYIMQSLIIINGIHDDAVSSSQFKPCFPFPFRTLKKYIHTTILIDEASSVLEDLWKSLKWRSLMLQNPVCDRKPEE